MKRIIQFFLSLTLSQFTYGQCALDSVIQSFEDLGQQGYLSEGVEYTFYNNTNVPYDSVSWLTIGGTYCVNYPYYVSPNIKFLKAVNKVWVIGNRDVVFPDEIGEMDWVKSLFMDYTINSEPNLNLSKMDGLRLVHMYVYDESHIKVPKFLKDLPNLNYLYLGLDSNVSDYILDIIELVKTSPNLKQIFIGPFQNETQKNKVKMICDRRGIIFCEPR